MNKYRILYILPGLLCISGLAAYAAEKPPQKTGSTDTTAVSASDASLQQTAEPDPDGNITAEARRSISQYQQTIDALQRTHGVYHDQLSEQLLGLGLVYRNQGQHEQAIEVLKRSLHINRINNGLHNTSQLPILELIIETNTALSDWQALDKNYYYLYWVHLRNYGNEDPRLLPIIDRLGRWHINAYQLQSDELLFRHLLDANALYKNAVAIIETHYGQFDPRLIDPLYAIALTNYQMAAYASNLENSDDIRSSFTGNRHRRRLSEQEIVQQNLLANSYRTGKRAMTRIIDIYESNPQLPSDSHALALIHLGDWHQLFNKRTTAMMNYQQAYAFLSEHQTDTLDIDKLFARPRTLPAIQLPLPYKNKQDNKNKPSVLVSFNVTKTGRARNIQIIESDPADDASLQRRAKKSVKLTRFRPRLENGKPVETTDVSIRYIYDE